MSTLIGTVNTSQSLSVTIQSNQLDVTMSPSIPSNFDGWAYSFDGSLYHILLDEDPQTVTYSAYGNHTLYFRGVNLINSEEILDDETVSQAFSLAVASTESPLITTTDFSKKLFKNETLSDYSKEYNESTEFFGAQCALSSNGKNLVISQSSTGKLFVYKNEGGGWNQKGDTITAPKGFIDNSGNKLMVQQGASGYLYTWNTSGTATYSTGQLVLHNGKKWQALQTTTEEPSSSSSHWASADTKGEVYEYSNDQWTKKADNFHVEIFGDSIGAVDENLNTVIEAPSDLKDEITVNTFNSNSDEWNRTSISIPTATIDSNTVDLSYGDLSLSDDGNYLAVFWYYGNSYFRIKIYDKNNGWAQRGADLSLDNISPEYYSLAHIDRSFDISSDATRIIFGHTGRNGEYPSPYTSGKVYIFDFNSSSDSWSQVGDTLVTDSPTTYTSGSNTYPNTENTNFGQEVGISSDGQKILIRESTVFDPEGNFASGGRYYNRFIFADYDSNDGWTTTETVKVGKWDTPIASSADFKIHAMTGMHATGSGSTPAPSYVNIYSYIDADNFPKVGNDIVGAAIGMNESGSRVLARDHQNSKAVLYFNDPDDGWTEHSSIPDSTFSQLGLFVAGANSQNLEKYFLSDDGNKVMSFWRSNANLSSAQYHIKVVVLNYNSTSGWQLLSNSNLSFGDSGFTLMNHGYNDDRHPIKVSGDLNTILIGLESTNNSGLRFNGNKRKYQIWKYESNSWVDRSSILDDLSTDTMYGQYSDWSSSNTYTENDYVLKSHTPSAGQPTGLYLFKSLISSNQGNSPIDDGSFFDEDNGKWAMVLNDKVASVALDNSGNFIAFTDFENEVIKIYEYDSGSVSWSQKGASISFSNFNLGSIDSSVYDPNINMPNTNVSGSVVYSRTDFSAPVIVAHSVAATLRGIQQLHIGEGGNIIAVETQDDSRAYSLPERVAANISGVSYNSRNKHMKMGSVDIWEYNSGNWSFKSKIRQQSGWISGAQGYDKNEILPGGFNSAGSRIILNYQDADAISHSKDVRIYGFDQDHGYLGIENIEDVGVADHDYDRRFQVYSKHTTAFATSNSDSSVYSGYPTTTSVYGQPDTESFTSSLISSIPSGSFSKLGSGFEGEDYQYAGFGGNSGAMISTSSDGTIIAYATRGRISSGQYIPGKVKVFQYSNNSWSQLGSDISEPSDGGSDSSANNESSDLGSNINSISLSSNGLTIAIGATFGTNSRDNDQWGQQGVIQVLEYSNGSWSQIGSKIFGDSANDQLGNIVKLSSDGTTLASSTPFVGNGACVVYKNTSGSWVQLGDDIVGDSNGDRFGLSFSLNSDGTIIAIGAPYGNDSVAQDSGYAKVFEYTNGSWSLLGEKILGTNYIDRVGEVANISSDGSIIMIRGKNSKMETYDYQNGDWQNRGLVLAGSDLEEGSVIMSANGSKVITFTNSSLTYMQYNSNTGFYETISTLSRDDFAGNSPSIESAHISGDGSTVITATGTWSNNNSGTVEVFKFS
jgi:hypothetical protein